MIDFSNVIDLTDIPREKWRKEYIGDGYRSACVMNDSQRNTNIILFGYDKMDNPQTFLCPHKPHIKYTVKYKTDEIDIYDRYVETRYFQNTKKRDDFIKSSGDLMNIIECFSPVSEFLHEMFDDVVLEANFNKQDIRTFFLDIETEISRSFEYPKTARNRINALTIYDTLTKKYYVWSLSSQPVTITEEPLTSLPKDSIEIHYFNDNETRMLQDLLNWWEHNYCDLLNGYNSQSYDIPYLVRRIENVLGENEAKRLSPVGRYYIRENNLENSRANKQAEILVEIDGIFNCDELVLYRDKYKCKNPLDGGYSLDNVGEAEGLGHKIHYNGSLKDLYENDWSRFINYNIRDVDLLRRLEEKKKLVPLTRKITSAGLCNCGAIYSSISYLIGSLTQFAKTKMNRVMVSYKQKESKKDKKFEGAYVFEPVPGVYRGGIGTIDFNSLYPHVCMVNNLSPETTIGHLEEDWFEHTSDESPVLSDVQNFSLNVKNVDLLKKITKMMIVDLAKKNNVDLGDKEALKKLAIDNDVLLNLRSGHIQISRKQIDRLLVDHCIITRNNDLFVRHKVKRGVVAEWSRFFYKYRKQLKNRKAELEDKIDDKIIVNQEDVKNTLTEISNLEDGQQSTKIRLNSLFGIIGTNFSPIFDPDIAQSITRTGKFCNRNATLFYKKYLKDNFNINDKYVVVCSGDTDTFLSSTKIRIKRQ